jgi:hypothetical protein
VEGSQAVSMHHRLELMLSTENISLQTERVDRNYRPKCNIVFKHISRSVCQHLGLVLAENVEDTSRCRHRECVRVR